MKRLVIFSILILALVSCENSDKTNSNKPVEYNLILEFPNKLEDASKGQGFPDILNPFLNYREPVYCKGSLFYPKITVKRLDVGQTKTLDLPFSSQAKAQHWTGVFSNQNVRDGYKVEKLIIPDFLIKSKEDLNNEGVKTKKIKPAHKNLILINLDEDVSNIKKLEKKFDQMLCNGVRKITIRIANQVLPPDTISPPPPIIDTIKIGKTTFTGGRNGKYHSGYATYFGGIKNGKADGQGTMVFKQKHLIPAPPYSNKKITAQKGYRLSGRFKEGYLNSGVLYDANGKRVRTVYIGR